MYVEECQKELFFCSLLEGTYWKSCSDEINEVGWRFEMSRVVQGITVVCMSTEACNVLFWGLIMDYGHVY